MIKDSTLGKGSNIALVLAMLCLMLLVSGTVRADRIRIAVAANFAGAAQALAEGFERETGHVVLVSTGSTGKQYAQIVHGAPFDLYFAADVARPRLLDEADLIVPGTRFTYALGTLVLWSPREGYVDSAGDVLAQGGFRHLAMGNPELAPYGAAAREVLRHLGLWDRLEGRRVMGENIGQAFQFVSSGNAELGFVALSQVTGPDGDRPGSRWDVPEEMYTPIEQQAVLLNDTPAARSFLDYVQSGAGLSLIRAHGYGTP